MSADPAPLVPRRGLWVLVTVLAASLPATTAGTPGVVVLAAAAPALLWTGVLLAAAPRARCAPMVAAVLLAGAVLATALAGAVNAQARGWADGAAPGGPLAAVAAGPPVEELAKCLVLVLALALQPGAVRGPRDGLVWGALTGLGFAFAENLHYLAVAAVQGGAVGLGQALLVRGVAGGANHALFTAATGAGIGRAVVARGAPRRAGAALGGLASAVALHAAWNGLAAVAVMRALCGPGFPATGCAVPTRVVPPAAVLAVSVAFLVPAAGIVRLLAGPARRDG